MPVHELTLEEFATLVFTNDGAIDSQSAKEERGAIVLTTKTSYHWAAMLAACVRELPEMSEQQVITAYREALRSLSPSVNDYYDTIHPNLDDFYKALYHRADGGYWYGLYWFELSRDFLVQLGFDLEKSVRILTESWKAAETAYSSLVKKELIEDPVFSLIFGVPLAVVGFVPYGFTQRTRRGRTVYRRITALFWLYEQRAESNQSEIHVEFRLWKILTAFKRALAEEMEDQLESPKQKENQLESSNPE